MKKWLSLLLAVVMVIACTPAFALELMSAGDRYPLDTDQTISFYIGTGPTVNVAFATWEDSPFHTGLAEMTGVTIDYTFPPTGGDANQATNLVLAGDVLPDVMFYSSFMADAERYMEEGVIIDLTPYLEEYAPAYYAFLQANPDYDKAMKTDSGKYYGFGFFREDGGWNDSYQGPIIRMDWLEEQGLEVPSTVSEMENVMRVFKEKYNATFSGPWSRVKQGFISGAFGAYGLSDIQFFIDEDGTVKLAQAEKEWFEYLTKFNEWWAEGLIDQDILTQSDTDAKAKALAESTGFAYTSMGQLTNWRNEADQAGNGADWQGIPYITADDGSISMIFGGNGVGNTMAVISGDCPEEEIPTALALLDYAFTQEGNLYWNFGKQGISWDYDEDGNPAYLPLVTEDPDGLNDAISKYGGSTWSGPCIQATLLLYLKNSEASIAANDTWFYTHEDVSSSWKLPSSLTFTSEESSEYDFLISSITTLAQETAAKLITGEMSMADYDTYRAQLETLGLDTVVSIRQAAYDRFLAR